MAGDSVDEHAPAVDVPAVLRIVGGDIVLLGELVQLFVEDYPVHLEHMTAALQQNDFTALRFAAHAIKGAAGSLAAKRAEQLASELEHCAEDNLERAMDGLNRLSDALAHAREKLEALLGRAR